MTETKKAKKAKKEKKKKKQMDSAESAGELRVGRRHLDESSVLTNFTGRTNSGTSE